MSKKSKDVQEIDADTWAESGGTAGMFGHLWRAGKLKIVEPKFTDQLELICTAPNLTPKKRKK